VRKATKDDALQDIVDLGCDYDGYDTIEGLKGLVDDMVKIAQQAINDEYYYERD
jgi:hypothetical protein